ncbi:DeoR/GlpR family DNA-binding transcription regulator [Paenibacillus sp. NRS-1782]|uniref:DeoR/GlpR family DNA-binding transcription regulator n=1 Tax=unclassified Paenibacillus TaxID=185978 RepID=UPI003D285F17
MYGNTYFKKCKTSSLPRIKTHFHLRRNYKERLLTVSSEKQIIGQIAADMVRDGNRIILDSSTTVQACAERLHVQECSVITNSINQAEVLSEKDGMLKHQMMKQADQVIILADHSKFGKNLPYRFADLYEVDIVITDRLPDPAMLDVFRRYDVEIIVP